MDKLIPTPAMPRRSVLAAGASLLAAAFAGRAAAAPNNLEAGYANSPWRKVSDAEWKRRLPAASYATLRHENTERPNSSPLLNEHRRGTFVCRGCGLPLFRSEWKFNSGTGWPSFSRAMNVGTKPDLLLFLPRTEYHCARCLGHQGHIFKGEHISPTEVRYCNNGVALRFVPG
jgi:peptide-methionine (R)-S-oxide reductase